MREFNLVEDLAAHMSQVLEQLKNVYRTKDPRTDAFGKWNTSQNRSVLITFNAKTLKFILSYFSC